MWAIHPVPGEVADPKKGSDHNRGAAVDLSLASSDGTPVLMPTAFDHFGPEAWREAPVKDPQALRHREVLKAAMAVAGFEGIRKEWWHYAVPEPTRFAVCDIKPKAAPKKKP